MFKGTLDELGLNHGSVAPGDRSHVESLYLIDAAPELILIEECQPGSQCPKCEQCHSLRPELGVEIGYCQLCVWKRRGEGVGSPVDAGNWVKESARVVGES